MQLDKQQHHAVCHTKINQLSHTDHPIDDQYVIGRVHGNAAKASLLLMLEAVSHIINPYTVIIISSL